MPTTCCKVISLVCTTLLLFFLVTCFIVSKGGFICSVRSVSNFELIGLCVCFRVRCENRIVVGDVDYFGFDFDGGSSKGLAIVNEIDTHNLGGILA